MKDNRVRLADPVLTIPTAPTESLSTPAEPGLLVEGVRGSQLYEPPVSPQPPVMVDRLLRNISPKSPSPDSSSEV
jgi:hypothetical protein